MRSRVYNRRRALRKAPRTALAEFAAMNLVCLDALLTDLEPHAGKPFNGHRSARLDAVTVLYERLTDYLASDFGGVGNA